MIIRGGCRAIKGVGNSTRLCTLRMRNLLTTPNFVISRWLTMIPRQKIMVVSSEIIEIVAKSSDIYVFIAFSGQKVGH